MMPTLTDPSALKANRQGEITPEQRKALVDAAPSGASFGCGLAAVLMFAIVAVAGDWLSQHEVIGFAVILVVLIGSILLVGRITSIPMRRRASTGHAQAVRGDIVWKKAHYTAVANGRTLKPIYATQLPPGHYTFFCLDNTRYLLAAEILNNTSAAVSPISSPVGGFGGVQDAAVGVPQGNFTVEELRRALAATQEFHAESLDANRSGRLTWAQRSAMLQSSLGLLIFALMLFGGALYFAAQSAQGDSNPGTTLLVGGFLLVVGLVLLSGAYSDLLEVLGGRVETISGKGRKYIHTSRGSRSSTTNYYYEVGTMHFNVSSAAYQAFVEGVVYRAYYTPHTNALVNIEPDA